MKYIPLFISLLLSISSMILVVIGDGWGENDPGWCGQGSDAPSRIVKESDNIGGLWYDDFSDTTGIAVNDNLKIFDEGVGLNELVFEDDFEDYDNDESIADSNEWTMHGTYNEISFRGCDNPLTGAPSSNVMKGYNSDSYTHSMLLTSTFNLQKGYFETWVSTSQIDHSDHAITQVYLFGTTSSSPSATDRALRVGFNYGGFAYYTNSWTVITTGLSEDTWYRITISWDCSPYTADISIYDRQGVQLGSVSDVSMVNAFSSVRRVGLMCGHMANYELTTNYWDELVIIDVPDTEKGALTSVRIDKPDDGYWSALRIDKKEPGVSTLEITLLDQYSSPISGSLYDPLASDMDITFLNDLDVTGLVLIGTFTPDGLKSPFLEGWGVDWNMSGGWSDTFLTDHKIDSMNNMEVKDLSMVVQSDTEEGTAESVRISKPRGFYWYRLRTVQDLAYPSYAFYDVLDGTSGSPIKGFTNLTGGTIDITGIDPVEHRIIKLRVRARTFGSMIVAINRWSLEWRANSDPVVNSITGPSSIYRNNTATFWISAVDVDQVPGKLVVDVRYKHEDDTAYREEMIDGPAFDRDNLTWNFNMTVPNSAITGNYSFKVSVEDDFGSRVEAEFQDRLRIQNNVPTPPEFVLIPEEPGTGDGIDVLITEPGCHPRSRAPPV